MQVKKHAIEISLFDGVFSFLKVAVVILVVIILLILFLILLLIVVLGVILSIIIVVLVLEIVVLIVVHLSSLLSICFIFPIIYIFIQKCLFYLNFGKKNVIIRSKILKRIMFWRTLWLIRFGISEINSSKRIL